MTAPHRSAKEAAQHAFAEGCFKDAAKAFAGAIDERCRFLTERGLVPDS